MKKTKILFITSSFTSIGNSAVIRHNALVKGLIRNNCEVDVLTVKWPDEITSSFFLDENNGNIHFTELPLLSTISKLKKRVGGNQNKVFLFFKDLIKSIVYYPDICYQWKNLIEIKDLSGYDLMISSTFTNSSHFVANKFKKLNPSLFWIQTWGDPWFNDDLLTPWYIKPFIYFDENRLFKAADEIVFVSKVTSDLIKSRKKSFLKKINYIPRSFYTKTYKSIKTENTKYTVTYTGNITKQTGRNILSFIDSVELYNRCHPISIKVNLYTPLIDESIKNYLSNQTCVEIFGGVDYDKIPIIYANSDLLLFISNKGGTSMIPGKFYDYLGTDLPILCLMDDINDQVSEFIKGIGEKCIVIENDSKKISEKLDNIVYSMQNIYSSIDSYSPENIAKKYLKLYEQRF